MPVLGLIAGSGPLPFEVARAARERGVGVAIAAIEDNTDPAIEREASVAFAWLNAGELGKLIEFLRGAGSREVILAGAVSKREVLRDPSRLRPDARALALLGKLGARGDDAILRAVADELESEGLTVVESTRYLESRMTRRGTFAGPEPDAALRADLGSGPARRSRASASTTSARPASCGRAPCSRSRRSRAPTAWCGAPPSSARARCW